VFWNVVTFFLLLQEHSKPLHFLYCSV